MKSRYKSNRRGFTLIEISLVLTIIVVMAAISVPMFQGTLNQERLRKATESIAADWTRTRAIAMQTGETQLWACQLATGNYANGSTSSSSGSTNGTGQATDSLASASPVTAESLLSQLTGRLPQGIIIASAKVSELDTIVDMGQATTSTDSGNATMFFYPDGTSSMGRLTLQMEDNENLSMVVLINGLSGTVRVLRTAGTSQ